MSTSDQSQHQLKKLSFKQIEDATNNFETRIGEGGYGRVYKGELSVDGQLTKVAVKRLNEQFGQGFKEFSAEIQLLSGQKNENLISLIGYCDEGKEKILVYEYAEHGSLDWYISSSSNSRLTWLERLKICVGAAHGLNHLHNHAGEHQTIIHRDIKSANILLDHNWVAKISDFGLSKLSLAGYDRSAVISRACGTPGYCEPEYITTGIVTKESDVYSFGVVLFEVVCGRMCSVKDNDGFMLSAKLAKELYEMRNLNEIMEPGLRKQMSPVSMKRFSTTAYRCLHDDREQRPPMDLVAEELERSLKIQEEYELEKRQNLKSFSDENWEINLPDDVEDIISGLELDPPLVYTTAKELFSLLHQGFFFDHDHRYFFIDNDGIKCEMISAQAFLKWKSKSMTWTGIIRDTEIVKGRGRGRDRGMGRGRGPGEDNLEPERCHVMGQYPHIEALNVRCQIRTSMLSRGIMYAANLVFSFGMWDSPGSVVDSPNCVWIKWQCQHMRVSSAHYAQRLQHTHGNNRNIMMMATLWHFVNNDKNANFDIVLNRILGAVEDEFPYILIHGFVFHPVGMKKQHNGSKIQEVASISDEEADWEKNMPSDYEKIIARSDMHLEYTTRKELYLLLCRGILIDNGQKWFYLCKSTGGKCHMLPAIEILSFDTDHKLFDTLSLPESRFKEVIRLQKQPEHRFKIQTESTLLSSGRVYACYLVFKFVDLDTTPDQDTCLLRVTYKSPGIIRGEAYTHLKLRKPDDIPTIKPTRGNRFPDSRNIPKTKESFMPKRKIDGKLHYFMEQRNDGWMEVLLFKEINFEDNQVMEVSLVCMDEGDLYGIIVQGIEFRPTEGDIYSLQGQKLSRIFVKWAGVGVGGR